ncbi:MAG: hypothetical protein JNM34_11045 [Chthonomonadaceae bacterium]|nr:hypothetical protein [Chthonomonadaceae bacterium]
MRAGWACIGLVAMGCAPGDHRYFPLAVGNKWSYSVKEDFSSRVEDLEVVRRVPVGRWSGFELKGNSGSSRLAWDGSTLWAAELASQSFDPPLPLFSRGPISWQGTTLVQGKRRKAEAQLQVMTDKYRYAGREQDTVLTTLSLTENGRTVQLETWFSEHVGILKQEQRTNDRRDRRIEYLSGP